MMKKKDSSVLVRNGLIRIGPNQYIIVDEKGAKALIDAESHDLMANRIIGDPSFRLFMEGIRVVGGDERFIGGAICGRAIGRAICGCLVIIIICLLIYTLYYILLRWNYCREEQLYV